MKILIPFLLLIILFTNSCKEKEKTISIIILDNELKYIPDSVFKKQNLTHLSISQEGYTLYPPLSAMESDTSFKMPLNQLPDELCKLTQLKALKINGSRIKSLPAGFSNLKNLEILDLSLNPQLKIINEIGRLKSLPKLRHLNIYQTNITEEESTILLKELPGKVKIIQDLKSFQKEAELIFPVNE